jgi:hypothetical protein
MVRDSKVTYRQSKGNKAEKKTGENAEDPEDSKDDENFFENITFKEKRAMYIKGFVQMFTFFVFLGVFTATVLTSQSVEQSRLAGHVKAHFTEGDGKYPLRNVRSIDDYWQYIQSTFLNATFPNTTQVNDAKTLISPLLLPLDLDNRIVGSMRFWQVRVKRNYGCQVGALFRNYRTDCFMPLMEYTQDKEDFGNYGRYKFSEDPNGGTHQGLLGEYPPVGHTEMISPNITYTQLKVAELRENGWIGAPTRAVFIDFTVWNMNLNLHAVTRILAEFSMSGVCETSARVIVVQPRHLKPLAQSGLADMLGIVGEVLLALFILFYVAEEITEFSVTLHRYFLDPWNVMDWTNLSLLIVWVVMRSLIWIEAIGIELGAQELLIDDHYTPMQSIAERLMISRTINSFNAVFIWGKVVKFIGFMPYVKTLLMTLETCWRQYLSFLVMFMLIFLAFVIAFTIGFGETIRELSQIGSTGVYLARSFLGDIDLTPVYLEAPVFGASLILFFMLGIYFLMMNVFFAIILTALDEARGKKSADFRQEMLTQSLAQIKQSILEFFSLEMRIRALAPGLWASMYKKTRLRRKQEEKQRLLDQKKEQEEKKRKIAHQTGYEAQGGEDWHDMGYQNEAADLDKKDILSAVENMAGKLLSKIQGLSFELTTEMRDLQSALTKMETYTDRLSKKLEDLYNDQVELLEEKDI